MTHTCMFSFTHICLKKSNKMLMQICTVFTCVHVWGVCVYVLTLVSGFKAT